MNHRKTILMATDFGPASEVAAEAVIPLARALDARVAILHVLEPVPAWTDASPYYEDLARAGLREVSEKLGSQKVALADVSLVKGSRSGEVFNKARALGVDLIVIGAGKKPPLDRFAPSPMAETVLELASQPVLAVHPSTPAPTFQRILCPVDHSHASGRGLRNAIHLARACGSQLVVLSVVPEISWLSAAVETRQLAGAADEYRRAWLEEYDRFLQSVDFTGVQWQKEVREGPPHREIVATAQAHRADVISMGSTGRTGLVRILMGSVTRHVLQELPCSLLTVKDEDLVAAPSGIDASTADSRSTGAAPEAR